MKELIKISTTSVNTKSLPKKVLGTALLGMTLLLSACTGGSTEVSQDSTATASPSVSSTQNPSEEGKSLISSAGLVRAADPDAYMERFISVTRVTEETPSPEPTDLVEEAVTLPEDQPTEEETPLPELPTGTPNTVSFLGVSVPINTGLLETVSEAGISDPDPNRETAPEDSAGIYAGTNLSVLDGTGLFLVGDNPGPFEKVLELQLGDTVNLADGDGKARDFVIQEIFRVDPNGISLVDPSISYYNYITDMSSEKLILQTSESDTNTDIRIIIATPTDLPEALN